MYCSFCTTSGAPSPVAASLAARSAHKAISARVIFCSLGLKSRGKRGVNHVEGAAIEIARAPTERRPGHAALRRIRDQQGDAVRSSEANSMQTAIFFAEKRRGGRPRGRFGGFGFLLLLPVKTVAVEPSEPDFVETA